MPGRPTKEFEKQLILERFAQGLTRREVAAEFGKCPDTIGAIVGPPRATHTKEQIERAKHLEESGMSRLEVSAETGLTRSQLYYHLGAIQTYRRAALRKKTIDILETEYGKISIGQIAEMAGCCRSLVYNILRLDPRFKSRYAETKREIPQNRITPQQVAEIVRLKQLRPKHTLRAIARRVGCSPSAVSYYWRKYRRRKESGD